MVRYINTYLLLLFFTFVCCVLTVKGQKAIVYANFVVETSTIVSANIAFTNNGTLKSSGTFYLRNNFTNNSTLTPQTGKYIFNGSNRSQSIVGTGTIQFYDLEIDNDTAGDAIVLNKAVEVLNRLDFTNGILLSKNSALLSFMDGSNAYTPSDISHVKGPARKTGNDAFTFPLGSGASYNPCTISAPSLITDHFTAEYLETNPGILYSSNSLEVTLDHISKLEYWMVDRTNGASNVSVTLHWDTASVVDNLTDLRIARWSTVDSEWKDHGNGGTTGTIADGSIITSSAVTSFSPFTLASVSGLNPLPIELTYFKVEKQQSIAHLSWITATEINNDYFIVERSNDGLNSWTEIFYKKGAGNSAKMLFYDGYDYAPLIGGNYYRLKQVDFNGKFTYSSPQYIEFGTKPTAKLQLYPNPAAEDIFISFPEMKKPYKVQNIIINDATGKLVLKTTLIPNQPFVLNVSDLMNGAYFINLYRDGNYLETAKFNVSH